jgi:transmembrane sensor
MNDPSSQRLQELFARYLERRCEPGEVAELIALLECADAADILTPPMRRLWEELRTDAVEYPVDWDKMYRRVSQVEDGLSILNRRWKVRKIARSLAVAAGVLLVAGGLAIYASHSGTAYSVKGKGSEPMNGGAGGRSGVTDGAGAGVKAIAKEAKDVRRVVHLADGSTVLLNKNSRLEYPSAFVGESREVKLTGEAYFDITHMTGRPFLVHTGKLTTRVLGTSFNIRAYPADRAIAITVTSGKVQVLKGDASMGLLTENQQIRYDKGVDSLIRMKVDVKSSIAWKPEEVNFDDITMEEAARRIGDWFGVTVGFVNPAVKQCRVTATFYKEDELEEILTVICTVNQSTFTIQDKKVLIDGRGCNQ